MVEEKPQKPVACAISSDPLLITSRNCPNCVMAKRLLEQAGITFTEMPAEENLDFVERYSIRQAPTLLIPTSAGADIYSGAGEINGYIQMRKRQLA